MPARRIWIYSKYPWTASPRSINPSGDASWVTLSKLSGGANAPFGEFIDASFSDNDGVSIRTGFIDVVSNGKTISVDIAQESSDSTYLTNEDYDLANNGFDLITTV